MSAADTLDPELLAVPAPRYSIYPSPGRFTRAVSERDMQAWLRTVDPGTRVTLYIHVPFCKQTCAFCAYRTQSVSSTEPVAQYLRALRAEIAQLDKMMPSFVEVGHVHLGGGSPGILKPWQVSDLFGRLHAHLPLAPDVRVTVEIDYAMEPQTLDAFCREGLTEASIGVQDLEPTVQHAIGCIQTAESLTATAAALQKRRVQDMSFDLVLGLPHQTPDSVGDTVAACLALSPDRLAVFDYAHVPAQAKRQATIRAETLPARDALFEIDAVATHSIEEAGYVRIGADQFVRPDHRLARAAAAGRLRRCLAGYSDGSEMPLVGLGPSAISVFSQGYTQNASATGAYVGALSAGRSPIDRGYALSLEDRIRGRAIEMLMCDGRLRLSALAEDFGDFVQILDPDLRRIRTNMGSMVVTEDEDLVIRPEARRFTRWVARAFDKQGTG